MTIRLISHSEVEMLGQCEKKHSYAFTERLQPKGSSIALQRGNAGHAMLETFFLGIKEGVDIETAKNRMQSHPKLAEIDLMPKIAALGLVTYWIDEIFPTLGWEIVEVEKECRVPIKEGVVYPFKTDLIVRRNNKLYVVDHKFSSDAYSDNLVDILPQIPRYVAGLNRLGIPVVGGIYNFFRTRKLADPTAAYVQKEVKVSPARASESMLDLLAGMSQIIAHENDPTYRPKRTTNVIACANCGFYSLCRAELNREKTTFLRKAEYEPNTYGYTEEAK